MYQILPKYWYILLLFTESIQSLVIPFQKKYVLHLRSMGCHVLNDIDLWPQVLNLPQA